MTFSVGLHCNVNFRNILNSKKCAKCFFIMGIHNYSLPGEVCMLDAAAVHPRRRFGNLVVGELRDFSFRRLVCGADAAVDSTSRLV